MGRIQLRLNMESKILREYPESAIREKWEAFLPTATYATHYTGPNFFTDPYIRGSRIAILSFDGDEIVGVMTGVENSGRFISGLGVRPQTIFRKGSDRQAILRSMLDALITEQSPELIDIYTWENVESAKSLDLASAQCTDENLIIMLDLSKGEEQIFREFSQTRRNEIRKALKKADVEIKELETGAEIAELYEIHKDWNSRKGNQPDSFEDFERAMKQRDNRKVFLALHEGKIIAGSYYRFTPGGVVEYAANNSLTEYQNLRPNDLIGWRAIQWACSQDFTHFSMGGSHLFLRRFGGEEFGAWHYRLDRTFLKRHEKKEALKKLAVKTYLSLPVSARQKIKQALGGA